MTRAASSLRLRFVLHALFWVAAPAAQSASVPQRDLVDLSLEELAGVEITSVSRRTERLGDAAASVFVISADLIRRSGVTTLPEALRLAPNLQVARIDAGQYAISARGFNNAIGNKLLVLIDGRTVYAPFFSGVFWDQQDVFLEDVERIEVISGPGATLWGTNAVNGVINVITRSASQTHGGLAVVDGGNRGGDLGLRYGGSLGDAGHWRVYAKASRLDNTRSEAGNAVADGWDRHQLGFRADWSGTGGDFTLQGDMYRGRSEHRGFFGPFELSPVEVSGSNVLARWSQRFTDGSDLRIQGYYDRSTREDAAIYSPEVDILDFEFQHGVPLGNHRIMWGGGYRRARDDIQPGLFFAFVPARRTQSWKSFFIQDELRLSETLAATFGARLENNEYTGTEVLPSARLSWKLTTDQLVWTAFSRAVRAPARLDRDIVLPPTPPYIIAGGPDFVAEVANVYEIGYRSQPTPAFNYSATVYLHDWDRLRSGQPPPGAQVQNMIDGKTYGAEAWADWQVAPMWRLSGGTTLLQQDLHLKPGSTDPDGPRNLGNDPEYQWMLRSAFNLPHRQELDIAVRRVAALPEPSVPAYTAFDLRFGWRIDADIEVSVVGRDLFDAAHPEFNAAPARSEIGRSFLVRLRWSL